MDPLLEQLAIAVPRAESVEQLTRPLLEILATVSGMDSTYLTTIHLDEGVQRVEFARNTATMQIPEGLEVEWDDTLCKRSLTEGRTYTSDVAQCWGDSEAARALGICTYVSMPVKRSDGILMGTLCAASHSSVPLSPATEGLLRLFSKLIAAWLEREILLEQLSAANAHLATYALVDELTGLPNRRAITRTLEQVLARAKREGSAVLVGMIDMDGFKQVNDTHGHHIGDLFLQEVAGRLRLALREMDTVGRLGGDEFIVVAACPASGAQHAVQQLSARLAKATEGVFQLDGLEFSYPGASVGVVMVDPRQVDVENAFRLADAQMYDNKLQRRSRLCVTEVD